MPARGRWGLGGAQLWSGSSPKITEHLSCPKAGATFLLAQPLCFSPVIKPGQHWAGGRLQVGSSAGRC